MISDEAVEAAARWLWARDSNDIVEGPRPRWEDLATSGIVWKAALEDTREEARELLEAAAPHMQPDMEVFVRMFEGCAENCRANNSTNDPHVEGQAEAFTFAARQLRAALTNPYRSQA